MKCPFCGHLETKVTDSRLAGEGRQIRRRRECLACGERFTTFETAELVMPVVVKGDRSREPFDEAVSRIVHRARTLGEREISSSGIGELVMDELRRLDEVAYVRFASVYRHFEDVEAFRDEIRKLRNRRDGRPRALRAAAGPATDRGQLPLLPAEPPPGGPPGHKEGEDP